MDRSERTALIAGLVAFVAVTIGAFLAFHAHHEAQTGTPVSGTVTGAQAYQSQYQCGSVQAGNVSIPTYCYETRYNTSVAVEGETAMLDLASAHGEGASLAFWKITDEDGSYSYGTMDPQSSGQAWLDLLWASLIGAFAGLLVGMGTLMKLDW